ncbi:MAG: hypothetical protein HUU28_10430 [Planctomycetaceae bacterium]|nr:hypothetical protein [Planctomycetaceae bacterium]
MAMNWTIEHGALGPRMVLRGAWSSAALEVARSLRIKELELNYAKGWNGRELDFLEGLTDLLESIEILDWSIEDVSAVHALVGLRQLAVSTYCKTEFRFPQFPKLEEVALEWRPRAASLFEHRGVKRVFLNKWNGGKDLSDFGEMRQLETLQLYSPARLEALSGIEQLTRLSRLDLAHAPRLAWLCGIEHLGHLRRLSIDTCRKISSIQQVSSLLELRELAIDNCGDIESLAPLRRLSQLERVSFIESTRIVDGDLSPLKELPVLRQAHFRERSHYSHSDADFE